MIRIRTLFALSMTSMLVIGGVAKGEESAEAVMAKIGKLRNVVLIPCDDLGCGGIQPNNPDSKLATPVFNRLAKQGINFTIGHTPSGVCMPTRYGFLCGSYPWRTSLKRGVLGGYSELLIEAKPSTIASLLKSAGYHTACVGIWQLGLGWQWEADEPDAINSFGIVGKRGSVDFSKPATDGPTRHFSDLSFMNPASLDSNSSSDFAVQLRCDLEKMAGDDRFPDQR